MANLEIAMRYVKKLASGLMPKAVNKSLNTLGIAGEKRTICISDIKIPFMTNDENVKKVIEEFQLTNPENMIKFMVEGYFAQFECISEGFSELKEHDINRVTSKVRSMMTSYQTAMKNEKLKDNIFSTILTNLDAAMEELTGKVFLYIEKIRNIDSSNRIIYFFKSSHNLKVVDTNNYCAKQAVEAIIQAMNLYVLIKDELNLNIETQINVFNNFKDKMLFGDSCKLMHDYDKESQTKYWLKLPNRLETVIDTADLLNEFIKSSEDEDLDYNNIEFAI